jgi:hypothetical protein
VSKNALSNMLFSPLSIWEYEMGRYAQILIGIVLGFALLAGLWLFYLAGRDFDYLKEAYDLAVIQTLAGSIEAIVAGLVAYSFGKYTAKVVNNRNAMKNDKKAEEFPLTD